MDLDQLGGQIEKSQTLVQIRVDRYQPLCQTMFILLTENNDCAHNIIFDKSITHVQSNC